MFKTARMGIGDHHATVIIQARNRTGATLLKGQVAMEDWLDTQGETDSTVPGAENSVYANLTVCTQAGVDEGQPVHVCLDDEVADNAIGNFLAYGPCPDLAVLDDDVSTTDIDKGDRIALLVSESAKYPQAWATGAGGTRTLGYAFEDAAADSTVAPRLVDASAHLRKAFWVGGVPLLGCSDT